MRFPDAADLDVADLDVADLDVADLDVADPDVADPDVADPDVADPDVADPDAADRRGHAVTSTGVPGPSRRPGPGDAPNHPCSEPTPGSGADLTRDADPASVARAVVLRKLTAAPRTRSQLAEDLRRRNVPEEVADAVLDRFTEVGLVDDVAFADAWVRSRQAGRGLSRRALRHELRGRGVCDDVIDDAVADISADAERQAASALVARKLAATRGLPPDRRTRRLVGMLARKGYPAGMAGAVVRDALATEATHE